jgi:predicted nuclease of predicted toxin-antitoxin system
LKLLVDAQLPAALARAFTDAGFPARHVRTVGVLQATDNELWAYARREGCAVVTKDEDFAARWARGDRAVPVVWVRIRNCPTAVLVARLSPRFAEIVDLLAAGETLIELR